MVKLTQKNFDSLIESFNHKTTAIEEAIQLMKNDISWIKKLGYYIAGIMTTILLTLFGVLIKTIGG